jgi:hypothetical protein
MPSEAIWLVSADIKLAEEDGGARGRCITVAIAMAR